MEERKRKKLKNLGNKQQMSPLIAQVTRRNMGVAQLLWTEEPKIPTPPCRK